MKKLKHSTLMCFLLLVFTSVYFAMSFKYGYWDGYNPGAGFLPRWCSGILLVLLVIYFFRSLKEEGVSVADVFPKGIGGANILICWAALIFFALTAKKIGMLVSSTVMLSFLFGRTSKWYKAILYAVILAGICFVIFKILLQVPVPVNKLGW